MILSPVNVYTSELIAIAHKFQAYKSSPGLIYRLLTLKVSL